MSSNDGSSCDGFMSVSEGTLSTLIDALRRSVEQKSIAFAISSLASVISVLVDVNASIDRSNTNINSSMNINRGGTNLTDSSIDRSSDEIDIVTEETVKRSTTSKTDFFIKIFLIENGLFQILESLLANLRRFRNVEKAQVNLDNLEWEMERESRHGDDTSASPASIGEEVRERSSSNARGSLSAPYSHEISSIHPLVLSVVHEILLKNNTPPSTTTTSAADAEPPSATNNCRYALALRYPKFYVCLAKLCKQFILSHDGTLLTILQVISAISGDDFSYQSKEGKQGKSIDRATDNRGMGLTSSEYSSDKSIIVNLFNANLLSDVDMILKLHSACCLETSVNDQNNNIIVVVCKFICGFLFTLDSISSFSKLHFEKVVDIFRSLCSLLKSWFEPIPFFPTSVDGAVVSDQTLNPVTPERPSQKAITDAHLSVVLSWVFKCISSLVSILGTHSSTNQNVTCPSPAVASSLNSDFYSGSYVPIVDLFKANVDKSAVLYISALHKELAACNVIDEVSNRITICLERSLGMLTNIFSTLRRCDDNVLRDFFIKRISAIETSVESFGESCTETSENVLDLVVSIVDVAKSVLIGESIRSAVLSKSDVSLLVQGFKFVAVYMDVSADLPASDQLRIVDAVLRCSPSVTSITNSNEAGRSFVYNAAFLVKLNASISLSNEKFCTDLKFGTRASFSDLYSCMQWALFVLSKLVKLNEVLESLCLQVFRFDANNLFTFSELIVELLHRFNGMLKQEDDIDKDEIETNIVYLLNILKNLLKRKESDEYLKDRMLDSLRYKSESNGASSGTNSGVSGAKGGAKESSKVESVRALELWTGVNFSVDDTSGSTPAHRAAHRAAHHIQPQTEEEVAVLRKGSYYSNTDLLELLVIALTDSLRDAANCGESSINTAHLTTTSLLIHFNKEFSNNSCNIQIIEVCLECFTAIYTLPFFDVNFPLFCEDIRSKVYSSDEEYTDVFLKDIAVCIKAKQMLLGKRRSSDDSCKNVDIMFSLCLSYINITSGGISSKFQAAAENQEQLDSDEVLMDYSTCSIMVRFVISLVALVDYDLVAFFTNGNKSPSMSSGEAIEEDSCIDMVSFFNNLSRQFLDGLMMSNIVSIDRKADAESGSVKTNYLLHENAFSRDAITIMSRMIIPFARATRLSGTYGDFIASLAPVAASTTRAVNYIICLAYGLYINPFKIFVKPDSSLLTVRERTSSDACEGRGRTRSSSTVEEELYRYRLVHLMSEDYRAFAKRALLTALVRDHDSANANSNWNNLLLSLIYFPKDSVATFFGLQILTLVSSSYMDLETISPGILGLGTPTVFSSSNWVTAMTSNPVSLLYLSSNVLSKDPNALSNLNSSSSRLYSCFHVPVLVTAYQASMNNVMKKLFRQCVNYFPFMDSNISRDSKADNIFISVVDVLAMVFYYNYNLDYRGILVKSSKSVSVGGQSLSTATKSSCSLIISNIVFKLVNSVLTSCDSKAAEFDMVTRFTKSGLCVILSAFLDSFFKTSLASLKGTVARSSVESPLDTVSTEAPDKQALFHDLWERKNKFVASFLDAYRLMLVEDICLVATSLLVSLSRTDYIIANQVQSLSNSNESEVAIGSSGGGNSGGKKQGAVDFPSVAIFNKLGLLQILTNYVAYFTENFTAAAFEDDKVSTLNLLYYVFNAVDLFCFCEEFRVSILDCHFDHIRSTAAPDAAIESSGQPASMASILEHIYTILLSQKIMVEGFATSILYALGSILQPTMGGMALKSGVSTELLLPLKVLHVLIDMVRPQDESPNVSSDEAPKVIYDGYYSSNDTITAAVVRILAFYLNFGSFQSKKYVMQCRIDKWLVGILKRIGTSDNEAVSSSKLSKTEVELCQYALLAIGELLNDCNFFADLDKNNDKESAADSDSGRGTTVLTENKLISKAIISSVMDQLLFVDLLRLLQMIARSIEEKKASPLTPCSSSVVLLEACCRCIFGFFGGSGLLSIRNMSNVTSSKPNINLDFPLNMAAKALMLGGLPQIVMQIFQIVVEFNDGDKTMRGKEVEATVDTACNEVQLHWLYRVVDLFISVSASSYYGYDEPDFTSDAYAFQFDSDKGGGSIKNRDNPNKILEASLEENNFYEFLANSVLLRVKKFVNAGVFQTINNAGTSLFKSIATVITDGNYDKMFRNPNASLMGYGAGDSKVANDNSFDSNNAANTLCYLVESISGYGDSSGVFFTTIKHSGQLANHTAAQVVGSSQGKNKMNELMSFIKRKRNSIKFTDVNSGVSADANFYDYFYVHHQSSSSSGNSEGEYFVNKNGTELRLINIYWGLNCILHSIQSNLTSSASKEHNDKLQNMYGLKFGLCDVLVKLMTSVTTSGIRSNSNQPLILTILQTLIALSFKNNSIVMKLIQADAYEMLLDLINNHISNKFICEYSIKMFCQLIVFHQTGFSLSGYLPPFNFSAISSVVDKLTNLSAESILCTCLQSHIQRFDVTLYNIKLMFNIIKLADPDHSNNFGINNKIYCENASIYLVSDSLPVTDLNTSASWARAKESRGKYQAIMKKLGQSGCCEAVIDSMKYYFNRDINFTHDEASQLVSSFSLRSLDGIKAAVLCSKLIAALATSASNNNWLGPSGAVDVLIKAGGCYCRLALLAQQESAQAQIAPLLVYVLTQIFVALSNVALNDDNQHRILSYQSTSNDGFGNLSVTDLILHSFENFYKDPSCLSATCRLFYRLHIPHLDASGHVIRSSAVTNLYMNGSLKTGPVCSIGATDLSSLYSSQFENRPRGASATSNSPPSSPSRTSLPDVLPTAELAPLSPADVSRLTHHLDYASEVYRAMLTQQLFSFIIRALVFHTENYSASKQKVTFHLLKTLATIFERRGYLVEKFIFLQSNAIDIILKLLQYYVSDVNVIMASLLLKTLASYLCNNSYDDQNLGIYNTGRSSELGSRSSGSSSGDQPTKAELNQVFLSDLQSMIHSDSVNKGVASVLQQVINQYTAIPPDLTVFHGYMQSSGSSSDSGSGATVSPASSRKASRRDSLSDMFKKTVNFGSLFGSNDKDKDTEKEKEKEKERMDKALRNAVVSLSAVLADMGHPDSTVQLLLGNINLDIFEMPIVIQNMFERDGAVKVKVISQAPYITDFTSTSVKQAFLYHRYVFDFTDLELNITSSKHILISSSMCLYSLLETQPTLNFPPRLLPVAHGRVKGVDADKLVDFLVDSELHYRLMYFMARSTSILLSEQTSELANNFGDENANTAVMNAYSQNVHRSLVFSLLLVFKSAMRFEKIRNFVLFSNFFENIATAVNISEKGIANLSEYYVTNHREAPSAQTGLSQGSPGKINTMPHSGSDPASLNAVTETSDNAITIDTADDTDTADVADAADTIYDIEDEPSRSSPTSSSLDAVDDSPKSDTPVNANVNAIPFSFLPKGRVTKTTNELLGNLLNDQQEIDVEAINYQSSKLISSKIATTVAPPSISTVSSPGEDAAISLPSLSLGKPKIKHRKRDSRGRIVEMFFKPSMDDLLLEIALDVASQAALASMLGKHKVWNSSIIKTVVEKLLLKYEKCLFYLSTSLDTGVKVDSGNDTNVYFFICKIYLSCVALLSPVAVSAPSSSKSSMISISSIAQQMIKLNLPKVVVYILEKNILRENQALYRSTTGKFKYSDFKAPININLGAVVVANIGNHNSSGKSSSSSNKELNTSHESVASSANPTKNINSDSTPRSSGLLSFFKSTSNDKAIKEESLDTLNAEDTSVVPSTPTGNDLTIDVDPGRDVDPSRDSIATVDSDRASSATEEKKASKLSSFFQSAKSKLTIAPTSSNSAAVVATPERLLSFYTSQGPSIFVESLRLLLSLVQSFDDFDAEEGLEALSKEKTGLVYTLKTYSGLLTVTEIAAKALSVSGPGSTNSPDGPNMSAEADALAWIAKTKSTLN